MDKIALTPLKIIPNPSGDILHAIKKTDASFTGFGEAYFSMINQGEIKGWKKHNTMTLNLIVPLGEIQFVIYDKRENSFNYGEFFTISLSLDNYQRLTIPPGLWVGFKGVLSKNMLLNVASIEHDPFENIILPLDSFEYNWK